MQTQHFHQRSGTSQSLALPHDIQQRGRDIQGHLSALFAIYTANRRMADKQALEVKFKEFESYLNTRKKFASLTGNYSGIAFLENVFSKVKKALELEERE